MRGFVWTDGITFSSPQEISLVWAVVQAEEQEFSIKTYLSIASDSTWKENIVTQISKA